jgi:Rel/ankyrin family protein
MTIILKNSNVDIFVESALTGELKICRIDKYTSSCEGGEEVFILVEKVSKSK